MLNFRGRPLNSLKGDVRQNLKMAYCLESHFKHFMLYNVSQNVFPFRDRKHQSFRPSPFKIPYYVINFHFVDIS